LSSIDHDPKQVRVKVFDFNEKEDFCVDDVFLDESSIQDANIKVQQSEVQNCVDDVYEQAFKVNPSPLKPERFRQFLKGYDIFEKSQLLYDLENGVRVPSSFAMSSDSEVPENHSSALKFASSVDEKIQSNLKKGWLAGPFDNRPQNLVISPLASVPKKDSDSKRMIHNLSYPRKNSVNSHIERDFCSVVYETIDNCIDIVCKLGKGALIAKADVKDAFYVIRMGKESFYLLGFKWRGKFYFYTTLPMGLSISCQVFECLSTAIQ
ncbi:MAG: hypothetical protein GY705_31605, partial [Bacteroidetes bacterium]|nr:hypothetical protein [Bacteroidota bacterium]